MSTAHIKGHVKEAEGKIKEGAGKRVARRYVGCCTCPFQLPLGMIRRFTGQPADLL